MKVKIFNLLKWFILLSPVFLCLFSLLAILIPYYVTVLYYYDAQSITTAALKNMKNNNSNRLNVISFYLNFPLSAGLFTTFLSVANYFLLIVITVKYLILRNLYATARKDVDEEEQVEGIDDEAAVIRNHKKKKKARILSILNDISLVVGILVKLNSILLQSFHSHSSKHIHKLSSLLIIIFLILYLWMQTLFSINFKIKRSITSTSKEIVLAGGLIEFNKNYNDKYENKIILLILFLTRFFLIFLITCLFLLFLYSSNPILQWLSAVLILIYFLTFVIDFYFHDYKFKFALRSSKIRSKNVVGFKKNKETNNEDALSARSFSSSNYSNKKKKCMNRNEIVKFISTNNFNNEIENGELSQNQQRKATSLIFTYV